MSDRMVESDRSSKPAATTKSVVASVPTHGDIPGWTWLLKAGDKFRVSDKHANPKLRGKVGAATKGSVQGNGFGYSVKLRMDESKKVHTFVCVDLIPE